MTSLRETAFVNTGDAPSELDDPHHFMRMILGLIRVNGRAFASVDPRRLLDATRLAADDGATRIAPRHVQRALEGH